jgi:hypothetical protein
MLVLLGLLVSCRIPGEMRTSRTTTPAPSPMTKPSRSRSNGRLACSGQSFQLVAKLLALANPAIARGWMQDSAPPATMTLASPNWIIRAASPMLCAPVVQAVVAAWLGPCCSQFSVLVRFGSHFTLKPYRIDMWPAARLMRRRGTNSGDTFR